MLRRPQMGPGDYVWGRRTSREQKTLPRKPLEPVAWLKEGVLCLHLCLSDIPEEGVILCRECGERFPLDPDNPNPEVCGLW